MAKSRFEYVKLYEAADTLLPNCWIVVRIDGKGFRKFADDHEFAKPNDQTALDLMTKCAEAVVKEHGQHIRLAYGQSDEYSFVLPPRCPLFTRRAFKYQSQLASLFAANYVMHWSDLFPSQKLKYAPSFDARAVVYPSVQNLRDYLSWRQADCHINNLYNTVFWTLVLKGGLDRNSAQKRLLGTNSSDKNEILFQEFGINYNNEPEIFRKGTVLFKKYSNGQLSDEWEIGKAHTSIINDKFWVENPYLLDP